VPRFAVLEHDSPDGLHWDLLVEWDAAARTWRLPSPPAMPEPSRPAESVVCTALADHRIGYLDYEGPVSGGRGTVRRWDVGTYRLVEDAPGRLVIDCWGQRIKGRWVLEQLPEQRGAWHAMLEPLR